MFRKSLMVVLFFIAAGTVSATYAAAPVIHFSDLVSGPNTGGKDNKGVFVTIVGKGFGSTRGSGKVTVGGGDADNYPVWTDTKITFQLGANAKTGNITVINGSGTSNGVPFTVRPGNIYFVSANSPNSPGSGTYADPWRSPASFYNTMKAGDTCYFRAGTYSEKYGYQSYHCNFTIRGKSGAANNEIAFVGYPGEVAKIVAGSEPSGNFEWPDADSYYVVAGLTLQGSGRGCFTVSGRGHRIVNNDCIGNTSFAYGLIFPTGSRDAKIYGNKLHGMYSGNKLSHLLYLGYGASGTDFAWNHIYDNNIDVGPVISTNTDGGGYQFTNNIIRDNIIDGSGRARGIGFIAQASGSNAKIYNNRIINCVGYGVYIWSGSVDVYNNTFYNNKGSDVYVGGQYGFTPATVNVKNNIFSNPSGTGYIEEGSYQSLSVDYNAYYGNGSGPGKDAHAVNANPLFINAGAGDFHLQASSPVIDRGLNLSSLIARDPDGVSRPQGGNFDIGAFEYASGSSGSNQAPVFLSTGNKTVAENTQLAFDLSATDADGDPLTFSATGMPSGAVLNGAAFSWTPTYSQAGTYTVTFTVSDGRGGTANQNVTITVTDTNRPPVLGAIGNKTVAENTALGFTLTATDADGDILTYSCQGLPQGATFQNGTFSWTPGYAQSGSYPLTFTVSDGKGGTDSEAVTVTVTNVNRPPSIAAIGNKSVPKGSPLSFTVSAGDPDGDSVTLGVQGLPQGAVFNAATGAFGWTPSTGGTYTVTFTASDGSLSASQSVAITVAESQHLPVLSPIGNKTVSEGSRLSFSVSATDADGDEIVFRASGLPNGATFIGQDFNWIPDYTQAGTYSVTFTADDGKNGLVSETVVITVSNVNRGPVLAAIGNKTVAENSSISFVISATDPDGEQLTYQASNLPQGASFDAAAGKFSWIPMFSQAGTYPITFKVSDPSGGSASETIRIVVTSVDVQPPLLEGLVPARDEVQVIRSTNIMFRLLDRGKGVDRSTIRMEVTREGDATPRVIIDKGQSALTGFPGSVHISGSPADFQVTYDPPETSDFRFSHEQTVTVRVTASDLAGNAIDESYSFTTAMILRAGNRRISPRTAETGDVQRDNARMATDASGKGVFAVWEDSDGAVWFTSSADAGITFGTPIKVSAFLGGIARNPAVTVDASGNLYIVWEHEGEAATADICFARRLAGNDTFETAVVPVDKAMVAGDQRSPILSSRGNGIVALGWRNENGLDGVYYAVSTDKGASFWDLTASSIRRIDDGTGSDIRDPCVVMDQTGDIYAVWSAVKSGVRGIYFSKYNAAGSKGTDSDIRIDGSDPTVSAQKPWIGVRPVFSSVVGSTNICVVWEKKTAQDSDIFFSKSFSGATWSPEVQVNEDSLERRPQEQPKVAINGEGAISAIWADRRTGDADIYFAFSLDGGKSFKTNMLVNDDSGSADQSAPCVNLSDNGEDIMMMWTDRRGQAADIFFGRSCKFAEETKVAVEVDADIAAVITAEKDNPVLADTEVVLPQSALEAPAVITMVGVQLPPPFANGRQPSKAVEFGPSGVGFKQPVTIKIPFTSEDLDAAGVTDPAKLAIHYYNLKTLSWEDLPSYVDAAGSRICAQVSHFSLYGLGAAPLEPGQPSEGGSPSSGGGGGGGCFIATAAYGSPDQSDVLVLRRFRDQCLRTTGWGREFVKFYYRHSPALAHRIENNEFAKAFVRVCLKPLVFVAKAMVKS